METERVFAVEMLGKDRRGAQTREVCCHLYIRFADGRAVWLVDGAPAMESGSAEFVALSERLLDRLAGVELQHVLQGSA